MQDSISAARGPAAQQGRSGRTRMKPTKLVALFVRTGLLSTLREYPVHSADTCTGPPLVSRARGGPGRSCSCTVQATGVCLGSKPEADSSGQQDRKTGIGGSPHRASRGGCRHPGPAGSPAAGRIGMGGRIGVRQGKLCWRQSVLEHSRLQAPRLVLAGRAGQADYRPPRRPLSRA
jgi:hypothetical protein